MRSGLSVCVYVLNGGLLFSTTRLLDFLNYVQVQLKFLNIERVTKSPLAKVTSGRRAVIFSRRLRLTLTTSEMQAGEEHSGGLRGAKLSRWNTIHLSRANSNTTPSWSLLWPLQPHGFFLLPHPLTHCHYCDHCLSSAVDILSVPPGCELPKDSDFSQVTQRSCSIHTCCVHEWSAPSEAWGHPYWTE